MLLLNTIFSSIVYVRVEFNLLVPELFCQKIDLLEIDSFL